jgi:hypothetical protein
VKYPHFCPWRDRSQALGLFFGLTANKITYLGPKNTGGFVSTEYDAIFQWEMNFDETEVFKLAVCYEREFRKIFSDSIDVQTLRRNSIPSRNDPRKSGLFRHCWKMRRETRGLLDPNEYKNYIVGNLTILKIQKGYLSPNIICGDKAWVRYKVWKRRFDAKIAEKSVENIPCVSSTDPKIIQQIDRTKKFLFESCEGSPTFDCLKSHFERGIFKFWTVTGKVSHFYCVLSPWLSRICDLEKFGEGCGFSPTLLREKITEEVQNYFKYEFKHES